MFKIILRPFINVWEIFFSWKENIKIVENSPHGLIRIAFHPYQGDPIPLTDEDEIKSGDYIAELHIANLTLAKGKVGNVEVKSDLQLLPLFRDEMRNLAQLAEKQKLDPRVKAIWGVTMMGPGLRRLGFQLRPMKKNRRQTLLKIWMNFLKWLYSPPGTQKSKRSKAAREPQEYWMSIDYLIEKYGSKASDSQK